MTVTTIGVVIPAHDEEALIGRCIASIEVAAREMTSATQVRIFVVCDACTDRTADLVRAMGHTALSCNARNVGLARSIGADEALAAGADWLAFTDADTVVAPQWLKAQVGLGSDVVCGTVGVDDWDVYGDAMRCHFERTYTDADGHRHVHGANLGLSADAYRSVGGFESFANSEDVALVGALVASGARIAWSAAPRVTTSARASYRATAGFGQTLAAVAAAAGMLLAPADPLAS